MAAALQCCHYVPSPALSAASSSRRRLPNMLSMIVTTPGRRDRLYFPGLKLQQGSTAAALRPSVVVRAKNGGRHAQQQPRASSGQHFVEEREHVMRRYNNIIDIDHGCLISKAYIWRPRRCRRRSAYQQTKLSRWLPVSWMPRTSISTPRHPTRFPRATVYGTLLDYVDIFLDAADASYNRTVNKKTVTSFLGALFRGLASVSHILLEAALEALTHTHPRESLSEYVFNCDVKSIHHEFNERINDLEDGMAKASSVEICTCKEGRGLAKMICLRVGMAIQLSAMVTANAHLRTDASNAMSPETVEQIIRTYVSIFLNTAEDTCQRKVDRKSFISFLDALRGVAAISHILCEDVLAVVNCVGDSSSNYSPKYDVEALNHDMLCKIKELEMNFTTASEREAYEILWLTLTDATRHVSLFVNRMTNQRQKAVAYIQARNNDKEAGE